MIKLRLSSDLLVDILRDLRRPHKFAAERVGFLHCRLCVIRSGQLLIAYSYRPIRDDQYVEDHSVGACFGGSAIREAMQSALTEGSSVFHVHLHEHRGRPRFSSVDKREMGQIMPCFVNLCPDRIHGALVVSLDAATANVWGTDLPPEGQSPDKITVVGRHLQHWVNHD
jgi:hypothetical protein